MFFRKTCVFFGLFVCLSLSAFAQFDPLNIAIVPFQVEQGVPLEILLTDSVPSRLDMPVHGKTVYPVYAFDRVVIPSGTEVLGKITGFKESSKWKRTSLMLRGDFTPIRQAEITFDTLILKDGTRIPIETSVVSRESVVRRLNKGKMQTLSATPQERPGFMHDMLWSLSPYRPQSIPAGMTYEATLQKPLDFGSAVVRTSTLADVGAEPQSGSVVYARLLTSLNSKTTKPGTLVQAELTYPLFSENRRISFPVGSTLFGEVLSTKRAGSWNHGGEIALKFTKIEPPLMVMLPAAKALDIEARMVGVQTAVDLSQLQFDVDGAMRMTNSKQRFFAPAFSAAGSLPISGVATPSLGNAFAEAYGSNILGRISGGSSGFGLPAGVAAGMFPPLGLSTGAFNVGRSIYSNLIGHGKDIDLPLNTSIEVRLGQ